MSGKTGRTDVAVGAGFAGVDWGSERGSSLPVDGFGVTVMGYRVGLSKDQGFQLGVNAGVGVSVTRDGQQKGLYAGAKAQACFSSDGVKVGGGTRAVVADESLMVACNSEKGCVWDDGTARRKADSNYQAAMHEERAASARLDQAHKANQTCKAKVKETDRLLNEAGARLQDKKREHESELASYNIANRVLLDANFAKEQAQNQEKAAQTNLTNAKYKLEQSEDKAKIAQRELQAAMDAHAHHTKECRKCEDLKCQLGKDLADLSEQKTKTVLSLNEMNGAMKTLQNVLDVKKKMEKAEPKADDAGCCFSWCWSSQTQRQKEIVELSLKIKNKNLKREDKEWLIATLKDSIRDATVDISRHQEQITRMGQLIKEKEKETRACESRLCTVQADVNRKKEEFRLAECDLEKSSKAVEASGRVVAEAQKKRDAKLGEVNLAQQSVWLAQADYDAAKTAAKAAEEAVAKAAAALEDCRQLNIRASKKSEEKKTEANKAAKSSQVLSQQC